MTGKNDKNPDYEVGYRRPPEHTRFKRGASGNEKGRPKGRKNFRTDLRDELSEKITLRDGDREVKISKQRAMVKSMIARAIKGDQRAVAKAVDLLLRLLGMDEEALESSAVSLEDEQILAAFFARKQHGGEP